MSDIVVASSPDAATDRRLLAVHAYWASLAENGAVPARREFLPAEIPELLPFIFLVDVLEAADDFRFRLVGTKFTEAVRQDLTGRTVREIFPAPFAQQVLEGWFRVVRDGGPNWARGKMWEPARAFLNWQGLVLPLKTGDGIGQLLGAAVFLPPAAKK